MNTKNNQKVRLSEKLGLFMVYAGNIPLMTLLSAYFLIYYTTMIGPRSLIRGSCRPSIFLPPTASWSRWSNR